MKCAYYDARLGPSKDGTPIDLTETGMTTEYNAVQESIKIALDAADAATDVTSEYNKTKREHKKLEASVKSAHRYSITLSPARWLPPSQLFYLRA